MQIFSQWIQRKFINTELGTLSLLLIMVLLTFWFLSSLIIPVLASVIIAYLLDRVVSKLDAFGLPNKLSVHLVYLLFLGALVFGLLILLPLLWDQLALFFNEWPLRIQKAQVYINELSTRYPAYISKTQLDNWMHEFQTNFSQIGKNILTFSVSTLSKLITIVVYLVLVPLIVYFFMTDKQIILKWLARFLPEKRQLMHEIWYEIDQQMGHYISAKILEVLIVAIVSTIAFLLLSLNYAILLGVLVGISVLIPYVGVILVTLPVVIIGYMQWGFDIQFLYLIVTYIILMIVDGNILIPVLFSETMKLHPVAVIIAILIFGGLWGFWGIFFAIPLASVIKVLLNAWLRYNRTPVQETQKLSLTR